MLNTILAVSHCLIKNTRSKACDNLGFNRRFDETFAIWERNQNGPVSIYNLFLMNKNI